MSDAICILSLGACLLHGPLNLVAATKTKLKYPGYGRIPSVYTMGEALQLVDVLRGQRVIPQDIRPLCDMGPQFRGYGQASDFHDVDVVLVELGSPTDLIFRECIINRALVSQLLEPVRAVSRECIKHFNLWYRVGLIDINERARSQAANELVKFIPKEMENADLARAVITDTRSARSDIFGGFRRLRELIGRPMGVLTFYFQYFPDGRAVSWPAGFVDEIKDAAQRFDMPIFEPSTLVIRHGVQAALRADLRHYNDDFMPIMAEAIAAFAGSVAQSCGRAVE